MEPRALADALAHAFPTRAKFEQMLAGLDIDLADIPSGDSQREVAYKTVLLFDSQGRTGELVRGALLANPGNPKMIALLEDLTRLPVPVQGQIVGEQYRFFVEESEEQVVMEFSRQLDELKNQLGEIKTALALWNQSRDYTAQMDKQRNATLDKELEVLREAVKTARTEIVLIKEWQKLTQEQIVAFEEWRAAITTVRVTRYPQSYVRFVIAAATFLVLAFCVIVYLLIWGAPAWIAG